MVWCSFKKNTGTTLALGVTLSVIGFATATRDLKIREIPTQVISETFIFLLSM
jgi:hypothetical protein